MYEGVVFLGEAIVATAHPLTPAPAHTSVATATSAIAVLMSSIVVVAVTSIGLVNSPKTSIPPTLESLPGFAPIECLGALLPPPLGVADHLCPLNIRLLLLLCLPLRALVTSAPLWVMLVCVGYAFLSVGVLSRALFVVRVTVTMSQMSSS